MSLMVTMLTSCTVPSEKKAAIPLILANEEGKSLRLIVEVADEPEARMRGLMGREHLPAEEGMLFVFEKPQILSFWMKNTLIPLDILYFDAEKNFVSKTRMEPCMEDPCPTYSSVLPAQYALEAAAGQPSIQEVQEGWWFKM